jgi:hypothetical protein
MESLLVTAEIVFGIVVVLGGKLGLVSAFALPAAVAFSRIWGERFFRVYATATTAGIGLAIGSLLGQITKLAAIG